MKLGPHSLAACVAAISIVALSGCTQSNNASARVATGEPSSASSVSAEPSRWESEGYIDAGSVWARKLDEDDPSYPSCTYSSMSCYFLEVVPKYGCSSLYVQANITDSSGRVVDQTNDLLSNLEADKVALVELNFQPVKGGHIQPSEITCY
jgi:hypothetical protein